MVELYRAMIRKCVVHYLGEVPAVISLVAQEALSEIIAARRTAGLFFLFALVLLREGAQRRVLS